MERVHTAVFVVLFSTVLSVASSALSAQIGKPMPGGPALVQVVGCVEQRSDAWWLVRATEPVPTQTPWTSEASIKESGTKPLGSQQFRLIGVSEFNRAVPKGHKVEVKGMLIKDAKESRVNVTSLQSASTTCAQ